MRLPAAKAIHGELTNGIHILLRDRYGWPPLAAHYWLDTAAFGVEYGPASGSPLDSGPSRFSAQISAYCLGPSSTLQTARCS